MRINISIDDISPHPQSSIKVLDRCYELVDIFPHIKFTLFVPMAYTRFQDVSYPLNKFEWFCDELKKLSSDVFELGWHGYYHGILNKSNNDEFRYLGYSEACDILDNMFLMAKEVGIFDLFSPILRPPAFYMSPSSIKACGDMGIEVLALSSDSIHKKSYDGADESFNKVIYYDCNPPFKPLKLKDSLEIVYHACEWDKSYISKEMSNELGTFLIDNDGVECVFLRDM